MPQRMNRGVCKLASPDTFTFLALGFDGKYKDLHSGYFFISTSKGRLNHRVFNPPLC